MLIEIRVPVLPDRTGTAYLKAEDRASHFPVVRVAAVVNLDSGETCRFARIGVTGVAAVPFRAGTAEAALMSKHLDQPTLEAAARHIVEGVQPLSDLFASSDYRAHLVQVYAARAIRQAIRRPRP